MSLSACLPACLFRAKNSAFIFSCSLAIVSSDIVFVTAGPVSVDIHVLVDARASAAIVAANLAANERVVAAVEGSSCCGRYFYSCKGQQTVAVT